MKEMVRTRRPDYEYRDGLDILTADAYNGDLVAIAHFERDMVRRPQVLSDLEDQSKKSWILGSAKDDYWVDSLYFEADEQLADGTSIVIQHPWGDHINREVCRDSAILVAATHRESDVYALSPAGYGRSTSLPKGTRREMARTGSFLPGAELTLPALTSVFEGSDHVELAGISEGARKAIALGALATKHKISVSAIDPPSAETTSWFEFVKRFAGDEAKHGKRYCTAETAFLDDATQTRLHEIGDKIFSRSGLIRGKLFSGGHNHLPDLVWREPNAMRQAEGFVNDMRTLLINDNLAQVEVMIPELSHLNSPHSMWEVMRVLAREKRGEKLPIHDDAPEEGDEQPFAPEMYFSVLTGHTHMFFVARGGVAARLYGRTLTRK